MQQQISKYFAGETSPNPLIQNSDRRAAASKRTLQYLTAVSNRFFQQMEKSTTPKATYQFPVHDSDTQKKKAEKHSLHNVQSEKTQRLCMMCGCESFHELSHIKVHVCVLPMKVTSFCAILTSKFVTNN